MRMCTSTQERVHGPRECLNTPISLDFLSIDSVKRTGKSNTNGSKPGMPPVKRVWNSNQRSFRSSSFSLLVVRLLVTI